MTAAGEPTKPKQGAASHPHPSSHNRAVVAPHHETTHARHSHRQLHAHHPGMAYLAAAAMTALGILLLVAFKPAPSAVLQVPAGSISEDVAKLMPALEPDLEGYADPGISSAQLDEATLGQ